MEHVRRLRLSTTGELDRNLAEYRALGEGEAGVAEAVREFIAEPNSVGPRHWPLSESPQLDALPTLAPSPAATLGAEIARLTDEALTLEAQPPQHPVRLARVAELTDAERLAGEIDTVLVRRAELELRQRLLNCRTALDTRRISQFATRRRGELVTPECETGSWPNSAPRLQLCSVPVWRATERGRNLFDVALDAHRPAVKARVLSEGEQRALGIACFPGNVAYSRPPRDHCRRPGDLPRPPAAAQGCRALVEEAAAGRQVIVFTHHLIFYQEILAAAAARVPQVAAIG